MMATAKVPLHAVPRPVRDARHNGGSAKRRALKTILALGLMIGFEGMTAGPAAVATLPTQLTAPQLTAQADLAKQISFSPSLGQEPGLFSSILDGAFPFVKKIARPIPPPPDVDGMEDL